MANGEKRQIKDAKCLNRTLPLPAWCTQRQILVVEGRLMVKRYWNQPAGHLEADEP